MGEINRLLGFGWDRVRHRADGYPYEVDAQGNVRRMVGVDLGESTRELTPYPGGPEGEYLRVDLRATGRPRLQVYVHQLVAWSFLPGDPEGKVVDHINGDPHDNRAENLRYLDTQENVRR